MINPNAKLRVKVTAAHIEAAKNHPEQCVCPIDMALRALAPGQTAGCGHKYAQVGIHSWLLSRAATAFTHDWDDYEMASPQTFIFTPSKRPT